MFIHEIKLQDDGRYTIIYRDDNGKMVEQMNAAWCCHGDVTDSCDGDRYFCIYFEVTECNVELN